MRFNVASVLFVTVCLIAAVGSQILAKMVVELFSTPILASWILSIFLLVIGSVQKFCGSQNPPEKKIHTTSRLTMTLLHMADIWTFFIAFKFASIQTIAGMQVWPLTVLKLPYCFISNN